MATTVFDPSVIPIESVAGESAIPADRLTVTWIRDRFAYPPPWFPEVTEDHRWREKKGELISAAVLIPFVVREQGVNLLLTQRSQHLTDHAGQVSFPGGRVEGTDASSIETALRETEEEVGLDRRHIEILGKLPDYITATGYRVTPVVSIVQPPFELQADPFEVSEIFEVPLAYLMDGLHHQRRTIHLDGERGKRTFYAMPYGQYFIWGATAGMLRNLFHFLRA